MGFLKQVFNLYISSSIHVALSVYSFTWLTLLTLDLEYSEAVLYFVFYASITGYNFVKYFGIAKFRHNTLASWLKWIQFLSFTSFIAMCYYAFQLKLNTCFFIACFAVLTFLYAIPVFSKSRKTLRGVRGVKVYVIALVWGGVTVFIPLINADYSITTDSILLGIQRFLYVLVLMLPFEIRDLKFDSLKLLTIPQKLGVKKSKTLGVLFLVLVLLLEFFKDITTINLIIILFFISFLTAVLLLLSHAKQDKYYSSFWVEGLPIFWLILVLIFT